MCAQPRSTVLMFCSSPSRRAPRRRLRPLQSIKTYFLNDDDFNWNHGVAKAATGKYKEAEETLLAVQNDKYRWVWVGAGGKPGHVCVCVCACTCGGAGGAGERATPGRALHGACSHFA